MAFTYLQTTASTGIIFKISAVSLAQAPTNIPPLHCLGKPLTLGRWPMATGTESTGWVTEAKPVTANGLSHCTWSCTIQKSPFLLCCCPLEQWGRSTSAQICYHPLNKALKVACCSLLNWRAELYSNFTVLLQWSISWYLSDSIWVYLMLPNFLLQSCLSPLSLASVLMTLS